MKKSSIPGFPRAGGRALIWALIAFFAAVSNGGGLKAQIVSKEHIYIHTDRNGYVAGETVYFKAYLYLQFAPSDLSSSLLYQLSDLGGNILSTGTVPVTGGTAAGSIDLGTGMPQGVYLLNTMTRKLSAPLPGEVYSQPIYVFNPANNKSPVPPVVVPVKSAELSNGVVMSVSKTQKGRLVRIDFPDAGSVGKPLNIFGIMENQVVFKHQFMLKASSQSMQVPTLDLPDGILHFVLTDEAGKTLSSRLTSVDNGSSKLGLDISIDSFNTNPEDKKFFTLAFPAGTSGTFSVAVTETSNEFSPPTRDIFTSLLRDSTIGEMNINSSGELVGQAAWLPDTNFISIKGRVDKSNSKSNIEKGDLIFFVQSRDSTSFTIMPEIMKDGEIRIEKLFFEDTAVISYGWSRAGKKMKLNFDPPNQSGEGKLWPLQLPYYESSIFTDPAGLSYFENIYKGLLQQRSDARLLDTVFVNARSKSPKEVVNARYTRGVFSNSNMARVLDLVNEPAKGGANILDYLQGKVSGLNIVRLNNGYQLTSTRVSSMTQPNPPVNVYLDEQISNQDMVRTIPVNDVALVKYFPPGNAGMLGFGNIGALLIYTKKPEDLAGRNIATNETTFRLAGYTPVRSFQGNASGGKSNRYKNPTLYWNPFVYVAGEDNKFIVSFFSSNDAKQVKVNVQGFTEDGKLVSFEKVIP